MTEERPTLVCAYDGSDPARAAIRAAGALFAPAVASVVTVRDLPPMRDAAVMGRLALPDETIARGLEELRAEAEAAARSLAEEGVALAEEVGLSATPSVVAAASVWRAIEEAADDLGADAIACGTRGHGPLQRTLLGSTASSLLSSSSRPVLVASHEAAADGPAVIGYDGSPAAEAALRFAAQHTRIRRAVVACAWRSPVDARRLRTALADAIRGFVDDYEAVVAEVAHERAAAGSELARSLGIAAEARAVESGATPWHTLLEVAESEDAAVVVCGAGHAGPIASALIGSVSSGLVHHAELPVLVVPVTAADPDR